jgi:hypothetical protein
LDKHAGEERGRRGSDEFPAADSGFFLDFHAFLRWFRLTFR